MHLRSVIEVFNKRDNYLVNRVEELQQHVQLMQSTIANGTGGIANTRTDVGAIDLTTMPIQTRTRAAAVQDYKDEISGGNVDG